jgi:hypothetical protein
LTGQHRAPRRWSWAGSAPGAARRDTGAAAGSAGAIRPRTARFGAGPPRPPLAVEATRARPLAGAVHGSCPAWRFRGRAGCLGTTPRTSPLHRGRADRPSGGAGTSGRGRRGAGSAERASARAARPAHALSRARPALVVGATGARPMARRTGSPRAPPSHAPAPAVPSGRGPWVGRAAMGMPGSWSDGGRRARRWSITRCRAGGRRRARTRVRVAGSARRRAGSWRSPSAARQAQTPWPWRGARAARPKWWHRGRRPASCGRPDRGLAVIASRRSMAPWPR